MIEIKGIGTFETIPQIAADIMAGDVTALDHHLSKKWNIEKEINLESSSGHAFTYTPLSLALISASAASIKWLVEHGANLNKKYNYSFLTAAKYCDEEILRYLVKHGAKVVSDSKYGVDAFEQALFGNKIKNLPVIHELGYTVEKYGGAGFFSAIMDNNMPAVTFFVENGIDINGYVNEVHGKTTPLCAAARFADLDLCKYLVAHGADVTLTEKSGLRPYTIALERSEIEMADFFKSLEPVDFHNLQNKLAELKPYKLSNELLEFLQGDNLHFDFINFSGEVNGKSDGKASEKASGKAHKKASERAPSMECEYIDFLSIADTVPMKAGRQKLLRISRKIDNYDSTHIVWNPKTKMIAFYDEEHDELADIAPFDDFINNLADYVQRVINGDLW